MVRWLEAQRLRRQLHRPASTPTGAAPSCSSHKVFLSVGHDEYWSGDAARQRRGGARRRRQPRVLQRQRGLLEDALGDRASTAPARRTARSSATRRRTPTPRSTRCPTSGPAPGATRASARPPTAAGRERADRHDLHGQLRATDGDHGAGGRRQDALLAQHARRRRSQPGATATLPDGTLGYEWDEDLDNGSRPAGLMRPVVDDRRRGAEYLLDYGSTYGTGTATHNLTLYRARERRARLRRRHGAVVVGPRREPRPRRRRRPIVRMQQATVNLFADMGVQPATLQSGPRRGDRLDRHDARRRRRSPRRPPARPSPPARRSRSRGTAADAGGGVVGGVEVSVDGGTTWHPRERARAAGRYTLDAGRRRHASTLEAAPPTTAATSARRRSVTVSVAGSGRCPCTLFGDARPGADRPTTTRRSSSA